MISTAPLETCVSIFRNTPFISKLRRLLSATVALLAFAASASASQPGPGIPNIQYDSSNVTDFIAPTDMAEINIDHTPILLSSGWQETHQDDEGNSYTHADGVFAANIGRTTVIDLHRGYLVMAAEAPGSMTGNGYSTIDHRLYDISDLNSPVLIETTGGQAGYNTHGSLKSGNSWRSAAGWTINDDNTFGGTQAYPFPEQRGNSSWTGWQRKFVWTYNVNSTSDPYWIERYDPDTDTWTRWGDDPADPWELVGETGVIGFGFFMGNIFIMASDQSMTGVAAYDISDPANPVLLDFINTEDGIGSYWPIIWKHWVIAERFNTLHAVDFSDPTDLKVISIPMTDAGLGGPGEKTSHRQHYMSLQDDFLFVDRFKVDLAPLESGQDPVIVQALPRQSPPPSGSPTSKPGTSQWALPLGNLWIAGGYSRAQGASIWMNDPDPSTAEVEADTFEPTISYHMPQDGAQFVSTVTPIVMLIHETIETNNLNYGNTVFLREVDGSNPVDGSTYVPAMNLVYSMDDFLTINPNDPLQPGVTFEVIVTDDAFTDAVGNPIKDETGAGDKITVGGVDKEIAYRFSFTTDDGSNSLPTLENETFSPAAPIELDGNGEATVTITADALDADGDALEYLVVFGDGTDVNPSESNNGNWTDVPAGGTISVTHTYSDPGNYRALLRVREKDAVNVGAFRVASKAVNFLVHEPTPSELPTQSTTIVVDNTNDIAWSVNPDNDSVARIDASDPANYGLIEELAIGQHPSSVALDGQNRAWVTCRDDDSIWVIDANGNGVATFDVASGDLAYGDRPTDIVFDPSGNTGYVTLEGRGTVLEIDGSGTPSVVGALPERNGLNVEFYTLPEGDGIASVNDLTAQSTWVKRTERNFKVSNGVWHGKLDTSIRNEFYEGNIRTDESHFLFFRDGEYGIHRAYGAIYRGYLEIQPGEVAASGEDVSFTISSPGPFRLTINGAVVAENTTERTSSGDPNITGSGSINLAPGRHYVEYRFYTEPKNATMSVEYSASGISQQEIPASRFYPANETRRLGRLAINSAGTDLLVAQRISDDHVGRIARYGISTGSWAEQPLMLFRDWFSTNTEIRARGVPNYIFGLAFGFNNDRAWYVGHKANTHTGEVRGEEAGGESVNSFQTTVRMLGGILDLTEPDYVQAEPWNVDEPLLRVDIDNHAQPSNLSFSPLGTQVVMTMQATNRLLVLDAFTGRELDRVDVGLAPQGLFIRTRNDGTREIWVQNFTDRNVTVLNGTTVLDTAQRSLGTSEIAVIDSIVSEWKFTADEVKGQQFFYSAEVVDPAFDREEITDPSRMALDGYLACAVCHDDGGHDGRTWDFSHRGEGLRNTIDLRGRSGISQGNAHWSGNFDEIHDFENDIRNHFGGAGLLTDEDFQETSDPLGNFKTGRNEDLDALVAYVTSLGNEDVPRSPYREADGSLTTEAINGRQVFASMNCATCHDPSNGYTNSERGAGTGSFFDVGTLKASSGERLAGGTGSLTGIDTPSLIGLHASAPYLHDGSASTVDAIFEQFNPGGDHDISSLNHSDRRALLAYLLQIDGREDDGTQPANQPGALRVSTNLVDVNEDGGSVQVLVERVGGSGGSVSVSWRTAQLTSDNAATADVDYTDSSGTLTWADGETFAQVIEVPIINDQDAVEGGDEAFGIVLSSPTDGATLAEPSLAQVNILENDNLPVGSTLLASNSAQINDTDSNGNGDVLDPGPHSDLRAGKWSGPVASVIAFQLPSDFDAANLWGLNLRLSRNTTGFTNSNTPDLIVDLLRVSDTADLNASDFEAASLGRVATRLLEDSDAANVVKSMTLADQQNFIDLVGDNGGGPNKYVVLRLATDGLPGPSWMHWRINGDTDSIPPDLQIVEFNETDTLRIDTESLPDATEGTAYSETLAAVNGSTPYAWALDSGPSWLSIDTSTGELYGTPGASDVGTAAVTVTVTDDASATNTKSFALGVVEGSEVPVTTRYEAEDFTAQSGTNTKTGNNSTGSFQDYGGSGTYIEWNNVDGGNGGTATLDITYAMGSGAARYADIYINGESTPSVSNLEFLNSGGWSSWTIVSTNVTLNSGMNTIRIEASPGSQGPNIDFMEVTVNGSGGGDTTPPAAPTNLVANGGDGQVTLDWDDNSESDLAGYDVYRGTSSGFTPSSSNRLNTSLLTDSNYTDTTVTNGTEYFYVVSAVDTSNNVSLASNEASATPSAPVGGGSVVIAGTTYTESDFASYDSASNQDDPATGSVVIDDSVSPTEIQITGNRWVSLPLGYDVTADTILKFEVSVPTQGEIQGIGLDENDDFDDAKRLFQVYGSDSWSNAYYVLDGPVISESSGTWDYAAFAPGWVEYTIPVGQYYTGTGASLVIANDHDVANPDAEIRFRNIEVYEDSGLPTALVHWDFDENGGSTAGDASGNGRDGVITGATYSTDTPDSSTSALSFDGSGDLVEDADAENYLSGLSAFTVSVWVKSTGNSTNKGIFITDTPNGGDDVLGLRYDAAGWSGGGTSVIKGGFTSTGGNSVFESASNVQSTAWQHLVLSWSDGGAAKLYVDGVETVYTDTASTVSGTLNGITTLMVGRGAKDAPSGSWSGLIDDFRIFGEQLTAQQIADIYSGN